MNKKQLKLIAMAFFAMCLFSGCANKKAIATYSPTSVECLGVELDGSQTLRVSATGRNRKDAIEQARKEAVNQVVFGGVRSNNRGCDMRPLINEPNAKDKYEDYFNAFFADGGEYKKYTNMKDERALTKSRQKGDLQVRFGITVRVLRSELKKRLKADGILKD